MDSQPSKFKPGDEVVIRRKMYEVKPFSGQGWPISRWVALRGTLLQKKPGSRLTWFVNSDDGQWLEIMEPDIYLVPEWELLQALKGI